MAGSGVEYGSVVPAQIRCRRLTCCGSNYVFFTPDNLLREARRQKRIAPSSIPEICILDPDGDILRSLLGRGEARLEKGWACYHTQLYCFSRGGIGFGCGGGPAGPHFA